MPNKVKGMWRAQTIRATLDGETVEPFGPHPTGLLCFHESMTFVELMSNPQVAKYASNDRAGGTAEEDKAAMVGNLALFGTYRIDSNGDFIGNTVEGCTFPNWIGDERSAEQLKEIVDGDTMTEVFQSGDVRVDITWTRVT